MTTLRQLAAIMFTDIAGYTALMGEDEEKALEVLHKSREIQKQAVQNHGGKWLKEMGDGVLAQFTSAFDAVKCAVEIQEKAAVALQAKIRIGINLGDVTIEDGDVFGDGVNVASRLQAITDPGGIYISESVNKAIGGRTDITTRYIGEFDLKNVAEPVKTFCISSDGLPHPDLNRIKNILHARAAQKRRFRVNILLASVAIIAILAFLTRNLWLSRANDALRLAVLPVDDLSGNKDARFITDGIQAAVIDEVGMLGALRVISRTSASKFNNTGKSIPEIADALNINMVVESELMRLDDSVQIRFRLIKAYPEELQLWNKMYSEATKDILKIYDDVAMEISRVVNIRLTRDERKQLTAKKEINPEAYRAYLKSRFHTNNFTAQDFDLALRTLDTALQYDPGYAPAYIQIARVLGSKTEMGLVPRAEAYPKIKEAEKKAISLNEESAELHMMLASIKFYLEWQWKAGAEEFEKVIHLNPNHAEALMEYAYVLAILNEPKEARKNIEKALLLDPFNPLIESFCAWIMLYGRHYDEAILHCQKSLNLSPSMWVAQDALRQAYFMLGRYDDSFEATKVLYQGMPDVVEALETGFKETGIKGATQRAADALVVRSAHTFISPESIAEMYAYSGNHDQVIEWLQKAYDIHDQELHYLAAVPIYESLHNDPRFQRLLALVNVPRK